MSRKFVVVLMALCILLSGCCGSMMVNGYQARDYGLFNQGQARYDVVYEPCWGNIFLGVIGLPWLIPPIYFWGFDSMTPVGSKYNPYRY